MNNDQLYNAQQTHYYHYFGPSTPQSNSRVAADSVQDAYRLMAWYPMASATPTTHVTRHLNPLSSSASAPSYAQQYSFTPQAVQRVQPQYPPFSFSSSSLANALGEPVQKPKRTVHHREDSAGFFNSFVAETDIAPTPKLKKDVTPTKLKPYIDVPPVPNIYMTPVSRKRKHSEIKKSGSKASDSDDLGGFGSDGDDHHLMSTYVSGSSSRRTTGDRDDRAPIDKFTSLLEDIAEAEDILPPHADLQDLSSEYFSPLSVDCSQPLLHPTIIRKLTKHISKLARPTKRARLASRGHDGGSRVPKSGRVADIDTSTLSRILKALERTVKAGEDIQLEKSAVDESESDHNLTAIELDKLTTTLSIARDSVLAADCCIALLGSDRLTKQLYSEELITTCLKTIKNQLTAIIYPFVEATSDGFGRMSPSLRHILLPSSRDSSHRRQVAEIFQAVSSVIPRINDLIVYDNVAMSESIIIQAVYIAIGPFFVTEMSENEGKGKKENIVLNTLGTSAMRGLRLDALSLIRSIFANHEDQRSWIIEEILSSLIKLSDSKQKAGQFRLRDGRSIRTVSALLLQLVQTSAHDVRIDARNLRRTRQQLPIPSHDVGHDTTVSFDEKDVEEIRLYVNGLDSAMKAAKTIVIFLTQRSGKSKVTKNSNEAEYRAIFDSLVSDLLTVLFWPEWPAASLLLNIVCKFMVSSLDDVKTTNQNENNAAKILALDHLGVIAARLRSSALKFSDSKDSHALISIDEVMGNLDVKRLQKRIVAHQDLASHLSRRSSEDQAFDSARELTAVIWGQELAVTLQQCHELLMDPREEEFDSKVDRNKAQNFIKQGKVALRDLWEDSTSDIFDISTAQDEIKRIDLLSEEICIIQSLRNMFQPILNVVLQALDAPPVFMRTKALKALGQIVLSDPSILSAVNVRKAIESHLVDSSPAVRDAAVELIGKFMIELPEFAANYYQKIAERIVDTSLAVRKRMIKLLKSFYGVTEDRALRIDICTRIVLRVGDEDDAVKDLAVKTMEELWFQGPTATTPLDKSWLLGKATLIMGVSSRFKDRHSPLEDLLQKILSEKGPNDASSLHRRYTEMCEALIDGLVDASDLPDFTVVNCVKSIYLFTSAYPAILSGSNGSTLLPYLKNAATPEEQMTSDLLLRIFRASLPFMPKTALKFGQELQTALQPLLLKPSSTAGSQGLQEAVACMCAVVHHITHDYIRLVGLLRSCNARLQHYVTKPTLNTLSPPEQRVLFILLCIISLLCEHCSFDSLRADDPILRPEIDNVSKGPITEHVYLSVLSLYQKISDPGMRGRILLCLGFLFRAQPALMTTDASARVMDAIFASRNDDAQARLLKIIQDFLMSEAAKHTAKEKSNLKLQTGPNQIDMEELIGNTDGFADSGVSSAVVQRYLDAILQAAMSQIPSIQAAAVDILSFTVKQGLAHPIQSFPVIVALETSPVISLSRRASALHAMLHGKHGSLLNSQSRYISSARASFDYQKKLSQGVVQGYRLSPMPTALLQRWYSLVREKRATRQDFLQHLVKVFNVEMSSQPTQDDVDFARFMAENFATLEYKTMEEVLTIIKYLTAVLSTIGMQLVEKVSPSNLLTQLHAPPSHVHDTIVEDFEMILAPSVSLAPLPENAIPLMQLSVILSIIMILKAHLKFAYGISEEKCSKFVVGKKSAMGDRPAIRKHERPITWERLPYATAPIMTNDHANAQRTRFLEIWNEDGLAAEPEDDLT